MAGFGFGFGSRRYSGSRLLALSQSNSLPVLIPSLQWDGTAGSGFAIAPSDPVRSTAKPTLRLIVPPHQYYTDELLVGVMAGANYQGSLFTNMGLKQVVVHCEGYSRAIDTPSFQTFADANGKPRTYFGWWTVLRNDGRHGHARVYFEAVPNDPALQNRVIGPYQFSPQAALHDRSITVAASAGADFKSIGAALAYCRANAFDNPLVRIVEAGDYDIADGTQAYEGQGYCTIAAAVPGVRIAKPGYSTDAAAALRTRYGGLRFKGADLSIDMRYISEIGSEPGATRFHWMDGCAIVNSAGQGALWRGVTRPAGWLVRDGGWFTECSVQDCGDAFRFAKLVRGTSATNSTGLLYAGCPAVVGNTSSGHRSDTTLAADIPAISVRYTGTAATATVELAGSNAAAIRTVTLKIAGSAERTFTLDKSEAAYQAGTSYTLQHLVNWLNAAPGITATLLDASSGRAAAWLSLGGLAGAAFSARDIKATTLTLVTFVDVHNRWWSAGSLAENVIIWGNVATGTVASDFDLGGTGAKRDFLIANNAIHNDKSATQSATLASELNGANSHVIIAHNTLSTQAVRLRSDAAYASDAYDLFANNSVRGISWGGSAATTPIVNNHIHAGQTPPPSATDRTNVVGTTIGGDDGSLYVNDRAGDFRANGLLASSLAASVLRFNANGEVVSANDVKGAFRAAPEVPVTSASSVTQHGITYTFSEARPVAQYPTGDWRVLGPVTIVSMTPGAKQVSGAYIQGGSYPLSWVNGAQVNPGNRSWAAGGLRANNKDNLPQGLNEIPSITNYAGTRYRHADNQDPAATGQPLVVTTGSVMKFVSLVPPVNSVRPGGADMAVLTVVEDLGPEKALRPGVAQADKRHHFTTDDWDLAVFNNFPKPSNAPNAAQALARVQRAYACQFTDSVNADNAVAINNHANYGRETSTEVYTAALCLHLDYSPAEKIALLNGLFHIWNDTHERWMEGGECVVPLGGGNAWKKALGCIVVAALRKAANTAKLAEYRAMLDFAQTRKFAEDKQLNLLTPTIINQLRATSSSRPLDPYYPWMEGTYDFTGGGDIPEDGGTNWDSGYRQEFCAPWVGGLMAVMLTTGAKALWNRPQMFEYARTYFDTEQRMGWTFFGSNAIPPFHREMFLAYWPADPAAPSLVFAKVDGATLWGRFDKALDEAGVISPTDFTVKVNGATVNGVTIAPPPQPNPRGANEPTPPAGGWVPNGIFRENFGLILPAAVTAADVVTVSYAGGANKLRSSLDKVNAAAFTDIVVQNITESVGGANTAYPIVAFDGSRPDHFRIPLQRGLAPDAERFTLWIPHIKIFALPSATVEFFGHSGGTPSFEVQLRIDGKINVIPRDAAGSIIAQLRTNPLSVGVAYSLRMDFDATDPSAATGWSVYLNEVSAKNTTVGWGGGTGRVVGWSRSSDYSFGGTGLPYFTGEFGGMWLHTSERVNDPAKVAKFTSTTDGSLDIGTLGEGVTGTPPAIFLMGTASQFNDPSGINRGTGPKFFRVSGGVTDVTGNRWS